jgi:two-component system nitrate/nitrite sensor histidine kinase NarX
MLRWAAAIGILLIFAVYLAIRSLEVGHDNQLNWLATGLFAVVLAALAFFITDRFVSLKEAYNNLHGAHLQASKQVDDANLRLAAVFQLNQKIVAAIEEKEVLDLVLHLAVDSVGALGASFVPFDERGQPLTAIIYGESPAPVFNTWVEYLASPSVRQRCPTCQGKEADTTCQMLQGPFSDALGFYCLPIRWGEREFGILTIYTPGKNRLDRQAQAFIHAVVDEAALAIEGLRLRQRELVAIRQMHAVRRKTDLNGLLANFMENVRDSLKADFAMLFVFEPASRNAAQPAAQTFTFGNFPEQERAFLEGLVRGILTSVEPFGINKRHLALLQTIASQVSLVVQTANLMAELEYNAIMAERNRLAREIHDGLAQTLGFLKLQTAQMQNYVKQGEIDSLKESLRIAHNILAEAYLDVRQAIDGLRLIPREEGLLAWLEQTVVEFKENSGLQVNLIDVQDTNALVPEVQVQLIRIVQEALSNVRKHAQATQVWISCRIVSGELILEVRDDGRGFSPEDIPGPSRYGLQGMRERTELIGAEFQVISCPQEGTTVRVRLPLMPMHTIGESSI